MSENEEPPGPGYEVLFTPVITEAYGVSYLSPIINMYIKGKDDDLEYVQKVCEKTLATAQKLRDICRYPVLLGMDYDGEIEMLGVGIDIPGDL